MDELIDPFRRLLTEFCTPAVVRAIEAGGDWRPLWNAISASGFLDALVGETSGGAGLSLADVAPLIAAAGAYAVPLPVAETMVARALLTRAGEAVPDDPIALAPGASVTPLAGVAPLALTGSASAPRLLPIEELSSIQPANGPGAMVPGCKEGGLRPVAAVLRALLISGASDRILEMSVDYANTRAQFGKPVGRQQAVQQQLAVMAEYVVAARMAALIGARSGLLPDLQSAAVAKYTAAVAAARISSIAHAVHGAIGISEEHDLQLYTRRLHAWRLADGAESYWADVVGSALLETPEPSHLAFLGRR